MSNQYFPGFLRGDDAGSLRRDAWRLATLNVTSEARFAALEHRAADKKVPLRTESHRDPENTLVRSLIVGQEIVAISHDMTTRTIDVDVDTLSKPAIYREPWTDTVSLAMRNLDTWKDYQQCLEALEALDAQDQLEASTPRIRAGAPKGLKPGRL